MTVCIFPKNINLDFENRLFGRCVVALPNNYSIKKIITYRKNFNGHTHSRWKFPGQGLNLSHNWGLHCKCSNARSFNSLLPGRCWVHASPVTRAAAVRCVTHCATVGMSVIIFLKQLYWSIIYIPYNTPVFSNISQWVLVLLHSHSPIIKMYF